MADDPTTQGADDPSKQDPVSRQLTDDERAELGACEVANCTCKKFVATGGGSFDVCKTCKHRDFDHKIE